MYLTAGVLFFFFFFFKKKNFLLVTAGKVGEIKLVLLVALISITK
jgi:hypothetical protein